MTTSEPLVKVGILSANSVHVHLEGPFQSPAAYRFPDHNFFPLEGKVCWQGQTYPELTFIPHDLDNQWFELDEVTIGIGFHWERQESQRFQGSLHLQVVNNKILVTNIIPIEHYLRSVISSEMSATASLSFLKAHAVISRSWLLNKLYPQSAGSAAPSASTQPVNDGHSHIKWYDTENHTLFDVCADDHCQRYQGITRACTPQVAQAIDETRGEVLMYADTICDARFSKCCGGALEEFSTCWDNQSPAYLQGKRDLLTPTSFPDLRQEAAAEAWIRTSPDAFCRTSDRHILSQVLNGYDQETTDFYRWTVTYTQEELRVLIQSRLGRDLGHILNLIPEERGTSGRISRLRIVGSQDYLIVGKELEIRKVLSNTHLYSSAFVVDRGPSDAQGIPTTFTLTGAGWGHGVGLCQIGAAVMGEQGYTYQEILSHYYVGAEIKTLYP